MTIEEYYSISKEFKDEFDFKQKSLDMKFSLQNNKHNIGDIISDHNHSIKIEKIGCYFNVAKNIPECIYIGVEVYKNGKPKNNNVDKIFQSYIK